MKQAWRMIAILVGLAIVFSVLPKRLFDSGTGNETGRAKPQRGNAEATPVLTAVATKEDLPVYVEGVGTGKALNSVLIRSQVAGTLMSLAFVEGQTLKAGDLVATIDPRIYQARLDQAVGKKVLDEATLANARVDLDRYRTLAATKAVTQQQLATQEAMVRQEEAQLTIDQALIDSARTTLSYTEIRSPIAGRTGIRNVDVGSLIQAADTTGIVTVSQIQPISVIFNVPQQELPRINEASLLNRLDVEAFDPSGRVPADHGVLAVVDNTIDATTGTVRLKANFDNPKLHLWPGIFVNVRLRVETLHDAVTVPLQAIQQGPKGAFVFAVAGNVAKVTPVTLGQSDSTRAVVSGLAAGTTVITSGFQKLRDGEAVRASPDPATAAPRQPGLHETVSGTVAGRAPSPRSSIAE